MSREPAVTTYLISEPFERALKSIREALTRSDLSICAEVDISARVKRELNIGLTPCRILFVDSPYLLLQAATFDRSAVTLLPLHIGVTGRGPQTLVHWVTLNAIEGIRLPSGAAGPVAKVQALVSRALERIAMRRDLYETAPYAD